jgi:hypothetical protein
MKTAVRTICALSLMLLLAPLFGGGGALAHQPQFIRDATRIDVRDPEVSKAYYGELHGEPAVYRIRASGFFELYVNILAPDMPGARTDFVVEVFKDGVLFEVLDSTQVDWPSFYEPYGGDSYFKGPALREVVGPGSYEVRVSNPGNLGKYVLAIGELEEFPPDKALHALIAIPTIKKGFFGKSPWTALDSRVGLFFLAALAVVAAAIAMIVLGVRHWLSARRRADR